MGFSITNSETLDNSRYRDYDIALIEIIKGGIPENQGTWGRLLEEFGEISGWFKRYYRGDMKESSVLLSECGDLLAYLSVCNYYFDFLKDYNNFTEQDIRDNFNVFDEYYSNIFLNNNDELILLSKLSFHVNNLYCYCISSREYNKLSQSFLLILTILNYFLKNYAKESDVILALTHSTEKIQDRLNRGTVLGSGSDR